MHNVDEKIANAVADSIETGKETGNAMDLFNLQRISDGLGDLPKSASHALIASVESSAFLRTVEPTSDDTKSLKLRAGKPRVDTVRVELKTKPSHGHTRWGKPTPTYSSWTSMVQRCLNPKSSDWPSYGGRGIKICERWLGHRGFDNFLADMGVRPDGMTLDRKDVNGNYSHRNCRWSSKPEQQGNRRYCKSNGS